MMEAEVSTAYAENLALLSNTTLQVVRVALFIQFDGMVILVQFTNIEKDAQAKIAKAKSEAEDAKMERDEALSASRASRREESAWKDEATTCKSAVGGFTTTSNYAESLWCH
jgi:hypothetical protein